MLSNIWYHLISYMMVFLPTISTFLSTEKGVSVCIYAYVYAKNKALEIILKFPKSRQVLKGHYRP